MPTFLDCTMYATVLSVTTSSYYHDYDYELQVNCEALTLKRERLISDDVSNQKTAYQEMDFKRSNIPLNDEEESL